MTNPTDAQREAKELLLSQADRMRFIIGSTAEVQYANHMQYEEIRRVFRLAGFGEIPPVSGIGARALEEVA